MIDDYLIEWGPSEAIIRLAGQIAMVLRDNGAAAPLRVVPDGEGGISFERRSGDWFESLDILEGGSIELTTFKDCRLHSRVPLT